ncbi:hypothetical protein DyAD56_16095 [Dyella sp. AD56]|uniref:hypothetical protein n=1 Tax=Dyella sp. AD56 TaxID=1528744 RepID=UPI000C855A86|nr:hypothetical protein [Dyella sp. AD56]PMQ04210.1 hypothetical protein DyAD56_16095 [Dyella sp. AD56]
MTDILFLCRRARASTRCGASLDAALRHARQAQLEGTEAGLRPQDSAAIDRALRDLEFALKSTETHRQRLLRKADRKEQNQ